MLPCLTTNYLWNKTSKASPHQLIIRPNFCIKMECWESLQLKVAKLTVKERPQEWNVLNSQMLVTKKHPECVISWASNSSTITAFDNDISRAKPNHKWHKWKTWQLSPKPCGPRFTLTIILCEAYSHVPCWTWWPLPLIPALRRQRHGDPCGFEGSVVNRANSRAERPTQRNYVSVKKSCSKW